MPKQRYVFEHHENIRKKAVRAMEHLVAAVQKLTIARAADAPGGSPFADKLASHAADDINSALAALASMNE